MCDEKRWGGGGGGERKRERQKERKRKRERSYLLLVTVVFPTNSDQSQLDNAPTEDDRTS